MENDWRLSIRHRIVGIYNGFWVELTSNIADYEVAETQRDSIKKYHPELTQLTIETYYEYSL
jgi:hypothetical protein